MMGNRKRMNVPTGKPLTVDVKSTIFNDAFQFNFDILTIESFDIVTKESMDVGVVNGKKLVVTIMGKKIVPKEGNLTLPDGTDLRSLSARYVKNTGLLVVFGKVIEQFDIVVE